MLKTMRFADFVEINPIVLLQKGLEYPFIEMEIIASSERYVKAKRKRVFEGGGAKFQAGDTLFARITPCLENGKIAQFVGSNGETGFGSTEFFVFRHKEGISDPAYIFYLANSDIIRKPAEKSMSGASGRQRADLASIRELDVPAPPLPVQQKIADILSAYDDLIENNNRRIKILEEMAQNIYREWFTYPFRGAMGTPSPQFSSHPLPAGEGRGEGLPANRRGRHEEAGEGAKDTPPSPSGRREGDEGLLANEFSSPSGRGGRGEGLLANRRRGRDEGQPELIDSELGPISEGWEVKTFGEVIELAYGKALKAEDRRDGSVPVYGSGGIVGYHNKSLAKGPGIIVGRKGNVGSLYWSDEDFFPIDTVFYVQTKVCLHYAYYNLKDQNFISGDAAVPGLNRNQAYLLPFLLPDESVLKKFQKLVKPIFDHRLCPKLPVKTERLRLIS